MGQNFKLKNVRLSYANLFKARKASKADVNAKMVYGTALLIPKNHPQLDELNALVNEIGEEKFGAKWAGIYEEKNPVKDGDKKKYSSDPAYAGNFVINANSERKPQLVDRKVEPITDEAEIYSGCYVNASFNVYAFEGDTNKGVTFGLNNIQLVRVGPRLGGAPNAEEEFEKMDDDDGADFDMS